MGLKKEQLRYFSSTNIERWHVILIIVTVFRLKVKIYGRELHNKGGSTLHNVEIKTLGF